jgi:hypothetical protein
MPAASKAFFRLGRSFDSHRGEVVASGRITPTFCADEPPPPPPPLPELSLPHADAVRARAPTAASAAMRAPLVLTISEDLLRKRGGVTTITMYVVRHNIGSADGTPQAPQRVICCSAERNQDKVRRAA